MTVNSFVGRKKVTNSLFCKLADLFLFNYLRRTIASKFTIIRLRKSEVMNKICKMSASDQSHKVTTLIVFRFNVKDVYV